MNPELLQGTIDIVFKGNMLYLAPMMFIFMVTLFADRLIDLIVGSIKSTNGRRTRY